MADKNYDIENLEKDFNNNTATLEKIKAKISKNETLDPDEKKFLEKHLNPKRLEKKPPFSIMNLLHYCWSVSLTFSGSEDQKKLGVKLNDNFIEHLKRYRMKEADIAKRVTDSYLVNERFVNDLVGSLGKTVRNISFVKEALEKQVSDLDAEIERKKMFYSDLASFAPLSKEGVGTKILTFFGGGSIAGLTSGFGFFNNPDYTTKLDQLEKLKNLAVTNEQKTDIFINATRLVADSSPPISNFDILLFVFGGLGVMVTLTLIMRIVRDRRVDKLFEATRNKQKKIWITEYKPEVAEYLTEFYFDIKILIKKYYSDISDEILQEFWFEMEEDSMMKVIRDKEPTREKIEEFISDKILPHYLSKHKPLHTVNYVLDIKIKKSKGVIVSPNLDDLRRTTMVEKMPFSESGKEIHDLPDGIFGYAVPWGVEWKEKMTLSSTRMGTGVLEVHKNNKGKIFIVGFIEKGKLPELKISLFPEGPFEKSTDAVAIPLDLIEVVRDRHL